MAWQMEWIDWLIKQNNRCPICEHKLDDWRNPRANTWPDSGKVRAILCKRCHLLVNRLDQNKELLERAVEFTKTGE